MTPAIAGTQPHSAFDAGLINKTGERVTVATETGLEKVISSVLRERKLA